MNVLYFLNKRWNLWRCEDSTPQLPLLQSAAIANIASVSSKRALPSNIANAQFEPIRF